jgi:ribosomal protein S27AE
VNETPNRTCHRRVSAVVDARVIAEFPVSWWEWAKWDAEHKRRVAGSMEDYGECLRAKCLEFEEFLRDHRSQDIVSLTVELEKNDLCSACGEEWDATEDDDGAYCGHCGATITTEVSA